MNSHESDAINQRKKSIVIVAIMIPIAILHFVTGPQYAGPFRDFVNGYLLDILLPFGVYFLLCPQDVAVPFLRPWFVKALPVLLIAISVEIAQLYHIPIFGRTYDPWDFLMYFMGVTLATIVDKQIFPRVFDFWSPSKHR